ncbi:helix-turn-helix transcriptional regulator [Granulosicoccus antarcticus]|uniref:PBP domain-containing protein n=1 Tax=Granulosicoccus antarcticus IMCC3135 TaxID=1192854 RepID=A0A2Z2P1J0_9GAMM|nr:helix-turn-helix transcriptional regulator [Granulosicoccus antarcticus]ASJ75120.1 hypothetical protein IMCC3135_25285 [Granulosicoccus antarcticus IMCC3135]
MSFPADKVLTNGSDEPRPDPNASAFLTVPQLAELLHVNEKKIYQLAGVGEIPGTKVTGKWIFPRRLIEDWLLENSHGGVMHDRLLINGSDDQLVYGLCNRAALDWQQSALVSYSPTGTRHGLRMLDTGRADACFINWGASEASARRHMGLLRRYRNHQSWVIVRCLQRVQGLIITPSLEQRLDMSASDTLSKLILDPQLRWAVRQDDSGSKRLLEDWCAMEGKCITTLRLCTPCDSERSAAAALNRGDADICCGVKSTALDFGLSFQPIADISLDLVMSRKTYFRTLMQDFITRMQDTEAHTIASKLGGYTILPSAQLITID